MKLIMCAVRDSAVNAFIRPFCVPAVGAALRGFSDEVNRVDSEMNKHVSDYELFEIGEFDEESGLVDPVVPPRSLARAVDVKLPSLQ